MVLRMMRHFGMMLVLAIVVNNLPLPVAAATDSELLTALGQMYEAPLLSESTLVISQGTISLRDFRLYLDKGELAPCAPIILGSDTIHYGGLFTGEGRLLFDPPIGMERQQIDRFFKTDSLNRTFTKALIIFNDTLRRQLENSGQWKVGTNPISNRSKDGLLDVLRTYKSRLFFYQALTNLNAGQSEPFLIAAIAMDKGGNVVVQCDPSLTEEIALYKQEWLPGPGHFF